MMSQNCKTTYTAATTRDANNNTLYAGGAGQACGARGYSPPRGTATGVYHQQVTAKVMFGSVAAINDLSYKRPEAEREARRTH